MCKREKMWCDCLSGNGITIANVELESGGFVEQFAKKVSTRVANAEYLEIAFLYQKRKRIGVIKPIVGK
jgi:hypothetical protein